MSDNPFVRSWTDRRLLNDAEIGTDFIALELGRGSIVIAQAPWCAVKAG